MSTPRQGLVPGIGDGIVGRRRELGALRAWLEAARNRTARLVLCAGEPGIGKTRLAQELAAIAVADGTAVAWGRCGETEGAPAFWPWRQVLRSLGLNPDTLLAGDVESPADRFRVFDDVSQAVLAAADRSGLVVILDDVHWGDEPSLLVLRHLADQIVGARLLVVATFRDLEPASVLPRVLPDLLRSPAVERLDLRGFDVGEVREQLSRTAAGSSAADANDVLDLTSGNPLFVREVARAMAEGTWRPDRPPRSVLDVVTARLDRVTPQCRRFVQAAAIVGRDFPLVLVARALDGPVAQYLTIIDEAIAYGLVDAVGDTGDYRFVHALTRQAAEASLTTADRAQLHRAVADAIEEQFAGNLSEHLADIARHWAELAPLGETATARTWALRAADDAVGRLAYEEGVRLYRSALALPATPLADAERCRVLVSLGRAAYLAGDLDGCADAAAKAADAAAAAGSAELMGEAALVLEAGSGAAVNAVAKRLCAQALAGLGDAGQEALRARLLAQQSHLAFYAGEQARIEALSAEALDLARAAGDDRALVDALHARKEACPGPAGRAERSQLASEMLALAHRTSSARPAMWGELWRIEALIEAGQLADAADELPVLQAAVDRVGGPVSAWHLDRTAACIAQAQGRYEDAVTVGRRGFERMRAVEPVPARGAYFALQCALVSHVGLTDDAAEFVRRPVDPLPRFNTMGALHQSFLLLSAGLPDQASGAYQEAGPIQTWSLPAFFIVHGYVFGALVASGLGRHEDLEVLLERLELFRGEHSVGEGVAYMGPVELTLGRGAAVLGHLDRAVEDLTTAVHQAERAGARGFVAEARYHLATTLIARNGAGDSDRALAAAQDADQVARALGMSAYVERSGALLDELAAAPPGCLIRREAEVAKLVADGLTNRENAERLVISERTAQNHVQHILTKLGFASRRQIATWSRT